MLGKEGMKTRDRLPLLLPFFAKLGFFAGLPPPPPPPLFKTLLLLFRLFPQVIYRSGLWDQKRTEKRKQELTLDMKWNIQFLN